MRAHSVMNNEVQSSLRCQVLNRFSACRIPWAQMKTTASVLSVMRTASGSCGWRLGGNLNRNWMGEYINHERAFSKSPISSRDAPESTSNRTRTAPYPALASLSIRKNPRQSSWKEGATPSS